MICKRCHKEWDPVELGLACPACHATARPEPAETAALFGRAVALEQDKKYGEAFRLYALLTLAGIPEGAEAQARLHQEGLGTPRDLARAADGYLDAAEYGSVRAAYRLGRLLSARPRLADGRGTAAFWLRAAAALGSADAAYSLATSGEGMGLTSDVRMRYLDAAARAGHIPAIRRLFRAYLFGRGVTRSLPHARWAYGLLPRQNAAVLLLFRLFLGNPVPVAPTLVEEDTAEKLLALGTQAVGFGLPTTALRLFLLSAEQGSAEAALRVGAAYQDGLGTVPSLDTAINFYHRAAGQGSAEAALVLGRIYEKEKGDLAAAEQQYLAAAEQGTAEHQYILGDFYLSHDRAGEGVRRAVPWLRRAASGGCIPAADRLLGIDKHLTDTYNRAVEAGRAGNVREAFSLYENAAALGHAPSLSNLGYCLQKGIGCNADPRAAARAYREAVAAGSDAARLNLASCYLHGIGVGRDFARARALLADVPRAYRETAAALLAAMDGARTQKRAHRLYIAAAAAYHRGDVEAALRLRLEAAKMGSARASYMIGCHFEFGDGVTLDRERAAAWYEAAATAGYPGSRSRLKGGYLRQRRRLDARG